MARSTGSSTLTGLLTLAWAVALALLPWWIGFPLLLAMAAVALLLDHRLAGEHRWLLRHGSRWGLPGALFALQRALGGNLFAWVIAMLGLLTGYTLLAGLEAWLDRDKRRARTDDKPRPTPASASEWPNLALAPVGPPAEIIELQLPIWQVGVDGIPDPRGGRIAFCDGAHRFDDGTKVEGSGGQAAFSPAGRWFAARIGSGNGVVLRDRDEAKTHRLRGWQLNGWYREQPWLVRRDGDMPLALHAVLGNDAADD
jgi:hypothetical protein